MMNTPATTGNKERSFSTPVPATQVLLSLARDSLQLAPRLKADVEADIKSNKTAILPRSSSHMAMTSQQAELWLPSVRSGDREQTDAAAELATFDKALAARKRFRTSASAPVTGTAWSRQAEKLSEDLSHILPFRPSELQTREGLLAYFTHLDLSGHGIDVIDPEFSLCTSLRELTVSRGALREVRTLPRSLKALHAYRNVITDIRPPEPRPELLHLGLGYNRLHTLDWTDPPGASRSSTRSLNMHVLPGPSPPPRTLAAAYPSLMSIDVGHNSLTDLRATLEQFSALPRLRHVVLAGNPCALVVNYAAHVLSALPLLDSLDDRPLSDVSRAHMYHVLKRSGRLFGLAAGAEYPGAVLTLAVQDLTGLPNPEDVYVHLGMPASGPRTEAYAPSPPGAGSRPPSGMSTASGKGVPAPGGVKAGPSASVEAALLVSALGSRYVLRVSLGDILKQTFGPKSLWTGPHEDSGAPVEGSVQTGKPGTAAPSTSKPGTAAVVPSPAMHAMPVMLTHDLSAERPLSMIQYGNASSGGEAQAREVDHPVPTTVKVRDALHHEDMTVTLIEVRSKEGEGEVETVLGSGKMSLAALLLPTDGRSRCVGSLDGDDAVELHLDVLPRPAREALDTVGLLINKAFEAKIAAEKAAAEAAEALAAAEAAAAASAPSSRPPSAVPPASGAKTSKPGPAPAPTAKAGTGALGTGPGPTSVPTGVINQGSGSHDPTISGLATKAWTEVDTARVAQDVCGKALVRVGLLVRVKLLDL